MKNEIRNILKDSIRVKELLIKTRLDSITAAAKAISSSLKKGKKVILFGNGGSFADSLHIAAELLGRYKLNREPLPVIVLGSNLSALTAISNDFGYEYSFSKEMKAFGQKGDVAIAISTSGCSKNVNNAAKEAKKLGVKVIGLTGGNGGELSRIADIPIVVPSKDTPRIQESHIAIGHAICEVVEKDIFKHDK